MLKKKYINVTKGVIFLLSGKQIFIHAQVPRHPLVRLLQSVHRKYWMTVCNRDIFFNIKSGMSALFKRGKPLTSEGQHKRAPVRPFCHPSKYLLCTDKKIGWQNDRV